MDLQLGLFGPGPGREDFQDKFGPVDDAEFGHVFQVTDLDWGQFIVDDEDGGPESLGQVFDFSHLALAQVAGGTMFSAFCWLEPTTVKLLASAKLASSVME